LTCQFIISCDFVVDSFLLSYSLWKDVVRFRLFASELILTSRCYERIVFGSSTVHATFVWDLPTFQINNGSSAGLILSWPNTHKLAITNCICIFQGKHVFKINRIVFGNPRSIIRRLWFQLVKHFNFLKRGLLRFYI